jgi:hypothetical protein
MATDDVTWALETLGGRLTAYQLADDYYDGRHRLAFATDKFRSAFGSLISAFAENLCSSVVDTVADRLQVSGFAADDEAAMALTDALWQANRMDRRAGEVHAEALKSGDAYLIVWPGADGTARFYPQQAEQVCVYYDPEDPGRITKGAKVFWQEDLLAWRVNLYCADRIEKYVGKPQGKMGGSTFPTNGGSFEVYRPAGESWPLLNPWGVVPVFHFGNNAATGAVGVSELANVVPLQDALNKSLTDMLVAMEFVALPQRWITGLEIDIDETTGKPLMPFQPGADRVWAVGAPDARFGQFEGADLTGFLGAQDGFRVAIARVSRTPLHLLITNQMGEYPSGEALKTAEEPLNAKVRDRQIAFGNVWEDAVSFALRMSGVEVEGLACQWQDFTARNSQSYIEGLLLKKQLGASEEQLLLEAGYSAEDVARMKQEREAETADVSEQIMAAFDRGTNA